MFLGFAALAVDLGYVMVTRKRTSEHRRSAALGATRQLGVIYEGSRTGRCRPMSVTRSPDQRGAGDRREERAGGKAVAIQRQVTSTIGSGMRARRS